MNMVDENSTSQTRHTIMERQSERALVVTRSFKAPARSVFEAWTTPDLLQQWWAPKSFGISFVSCEADVRTGGSYRFVFAHPAAAEPMAFFGRYLEVIPNARLVWTNDEAGDTGSITTVTFEQRGDETLVVVHDLYPTKEALDEAISSGSPGGFPEQFTHLDALLVGSPAC